MHLGCRLCGIFTGQTLAILLSNNLVLAAVTMIQQLVEQPPHPPCLLYELEAGRRGESGQLAMETNSHAWGGELNE